MKIAIISYWVCPLTRIGTRTGGGMSVYIVNMINSLSQKGHKVDVYTVPHKDMHEGVAEINRNVRIIHLETKGNTPEEFGRRIAEYCMKNKLEYDVFHSHYYLSGIAALSLFEKAGKKPHFHTFHTLSKIKEKYLNIQVRDRFEMEKKVADASDRIIVSTDLEKSDLVNYYGSDIRKIRTVYPGVNHKIFRKKDRFSARQKTGLEYDEKIILFVGRPDPVKGLEILFDAFILLLQKFGSKKVRLVVIGGTKSGEIRELLNPEILGKIGKIKDRILVLGRKNYRELNNYYNSADIVTVTSVYESFGLVVIEAMACGCTVVASDSGGPSKIIKNGVNGILFRPKDAGHLSEKLENILKDDAKRRIIGENAVKRSMDFCWSKQSDKILKLYKELI